MESRVTTCPGCGLELPATGREYDRKFHSSAECWAVYEEVLAREYQSPALFGQVHQLTVDAYSVQHAGGAHPDKSVSIHLVGLYLAIEKGVRQDPLHPFFRRLAKRTSWPRLDPPAERAGLTVRDVARADSPRAHAETVREWAEEVWRIWAPHRETAASLVAGLEPPAGRGPR